MQYSISILLLITVVASQEGQARTVEVPEDGAVEYIISALRSTKVIKRDVTTLWILPSWRNVLQRQCRSSDAPNKYQLLEVADENIPNCTKGLKNPMPDVPWANNTNITAFTHSLCRFLIEGNSCFLDYTETLQPCLPRYKGGNFPFSNISQIVINYMCGDDEAIERSKIFWDAIPACLAEAERTHTCDRGRPIYPIEENTYMYTEATCSKISDLWKCVKAELHSCPMLVFDYMEALNKAVLPIYTSCPVDRTVQDNHIQELK